MFEEVETTSSVQFLRSDHSGVYASHNHKLIMSSLFNNTAGIEDEDAVRVLYAGQTVRNHNGSATF
jgi:hypothetical protein